MNHALSFLIELFFSYLAAVLLLAVVVDADDRGAPLDTDADVFIRWMVLSLGKLRSFKIV